MEQINHRDDEHDQSSNEENTNDDHQQLLFKYLAESLQKQQQQQQQLQSGPIDFSHSSNIHKKDTSDEDDDDDEETDLVSSALTRIGLIHASLIFLFQQEKSSPSLVPPILPPLLLRNKHGKPTRPFKAYPRDPLSLPLGFYSPLVPASDNILNVLASSTDDFSKQFHKRIQQAQERLITRFQGSPSKTSSQQQSPPAHVQERILSPSSVTPLNAIPPKKRYRPNTPPPEIPPAHLSQPTPQETDNKDDAYWERRRKNNEAAKRSRDARRAKEDEIALR